MLQYFEGCGSCPCQQQNIRGSARWLAKQVGVAPAKFTEFQQALGITHHPHSLLLNRSLDTIVDPVEIYMHDWMHMIFVDGVFNLVLYLLLETMIKLNCHTIYQVYSDYLSTWRWPKRIGGEHLAEIFSSDRKDKHRKAKHIKCQASDGLSLMGVTCLFARKVLMHMGLDCKKQCDAFLALASVVELVVAASSGSTQPAQLLKAVESFLELFASAWGVCWMTPKCHWLLHLPGQLEKLRKKGIMGFLNCFCLERKHRIPKRYATDLENHRKNSQALLMEVTSHHLGQLDRAGVLCFEVGLVEGKTPSTAILKLLAPLLEDCPANSTVLYSLQARYSTLGLCGRPDAVLFRDQGGVRVARIKLHCSVDGVVCSLVSVFHNESVSGDGSGYSVWVAASAGGQFIETDMILEVVNYRVLEDERLAVLLPRGYR